MKGRSEQVREAAEALAVQALSFIAQDGERLGRFLSLTGIGPGEIRSAAREPGFLAGVLEYLAGDERLLTEFAREAGHDPSTVDAARLALGGGPSWERETP
jgi:hypothetical protein